MTLTAQEVADRLYEYNKWRRGITEESPFAPKELGLIIDAAINLLYKHPTERQWIPNFQTPTQQ